jgi:tRNA nucleotidyltransferase (CCA-adding enzyme)
VPTLPCCCRGRLGRLLVDTLSELWLDSHMTEIKFFQVGGCVRDGLLGIKTKDIDFAVEAPDFATMLAAVEARCTKVFRDKEGTPIGAEFFTLRGIDPVLGAVDFVLCRKDGPSSDGRRPDFVEAGTLLDDLARRDFTMNAIAIADDGSLVDPHGGQEDIKTGRLRFVGKPADRLAEDALRALRGIRFEITKGFTLDPEAADAIRSLTLSDFEAVSSERVMEELKRCFAHDTPATLRILEEFPNLFALAMERGLWFKPTFEARR